MGLPGNAIPLLAAGSAEASTEQYTIQRSLRFNDGETTYLSWTPAYAGNRQKWTFSCWVKKCKEDTKAVIFSSSPDGSNRFVISLYNGQLYLWSNVSGASCNVHTTAELRDSGAWMHTLCVFDVTQSDAQSRTKIYINSTEVPLTYVTSPSQNTDHNINNAYEHRIGVDNGQANENLNAYLANIHFIDGEALEPSDFTEVDSTTGQLVPIVYSGDYGRNGFYLRFTDNANTTRLGFDFSKNGLIGSASSNAALPFYNTNDEADGNDFGFVKGSGYRGDSAAGTSSGSGLVLALPGDVLTDEHDHVNTGSSAKNVVNQGSTATSTDQARFYGTSMAFNGSGRYLEVKDGSGNPYADFAFGTGDFTVEAWVYANNWDESYQAIFNNFRDDDSTTGWSMLVTNGGKLHINHMGDYNNGATTIPTKQWVHLAMVKEGSANTTTRYINGVADATTLSSSQSITNTTQGLCIGGAGTEYNNRDFDGYIQDARIYKGVRKYTAAFTPPVRNTWSTHNFQLVGGVAHDDSSRITFNSGTTGWVSGHDQTKAFDSSENTYAAGTSGNQPGAGFTWSATGLNMSGALEVKTYGDGGNPSTITVVHSNGVSSVSHTSGTGYANLGTVGVISSIKVSRLDQGIIHAIKLNSTLVTSAAASNSVNDCLRDSPSNGTAGDETGAGGIVPGNYATWSVFTNGGTLSRGNLNASSGANKRITSDFPLHSGKWYYEIELLGSSVQQFGLGSLRSAYNIGSAPGDANQNSYIALTNGQYYHNGSMTGSGLPTTTTGDVIGVAFDADSRKLWLSKNGTWMASGNPAGGSNPLWTVSADYAPYSPTVGAGGADATNSCLNAGQRPFANSAPTGFKPLATPFLSDPAIAKPDQHFDILTYTGTGNSLAVTGLNFQPDFLWFKSRSNADENHWQDALRGVTKMLQSDTNAAEITDSNLLTSFDSGGFTLPANSSGESNNVNNWTFVSWAWKAASTASGTWGANSKAYSRRTNSTAGFSIIKYVGDGSNGIPGTGAIPHGLSGAPDLYIQKRLDATGHWFTAFNCVDGTFDYMKLDTDGAKADDNNTLWDSDEISNWGGGNDQDFIAYVFKSIPGYSEVGYYIGDGTSAKFITLPFRPRWMMIKRTDAGSSPHNWGLLDAVRYPQNVAFHTLAANHDYAESTYIGNYLDIMSNGVVIRTNGGWANTSGGTYLYLAFAESPFKYARAR